MGNLAFTLYEVFGYLLPGGVTLLSILVFYWLFFVPRMPLGVATFRTGLVTWSVVVFAAYLLGHAAQGIANVFFHGVERSVLDLEQGTAPTWMRDRARQVAIEVLKVSDKQELEPRWVFRVLDEYALQNGRDGDREIFVYREGFYRGTALSLFLLSAALLARVFVPGAAISFTKGVFYVSIYQTLLTAAVVAGIALLFVRRYQRFAEYRVTRAVIAALVANGPKPLH